MIDLRNVCIPWDFPAVSQVVSSARNVRMLNIGQLFIGLHFLFCFIINI